MNEFLDACESASLAAQLCGAEIWYYSSSWFSGKGFLSDSLSSAMSSASGSLITEKRSLLACSNISKELHLASSLRLPLISVNVSNSLSLNSGSLVFCPSSVQEVFDSVLLAYRICEDSKVLLPCIINIDNPNLCESMTLATEQNITSFLLKLKLPHKLDVKNPYTLLHRDSLESESIRQKAMDNALKLMEKSLDVMKTKFRRSLHPLENYMTEDAEIVFVLCGFQYGTAKSFVDNARKNNQKVGIVKLFSLRPFPEEEVIKSLENAKKIIIIDKISIGSYGMLFKEIKPFTNAVCIDVIARHLDEKDFADILEKAKKIEKQEKLWML